jgi:hypothetical protein
MDLFFAAIYVISHAYNFWRSSHSFFFYCGKSSIHIEFLLSARVATFLMVSN